MIWLLLSFMDILDDALAKLGVNLDDSFGESRLLLLKFLSASDRRYPLKLMTLYSRTAKRREHGQ